MFNLLTAVALGATARLEDIPNAAPVVTNEEDAVAMAAVGALGGAVSNKVDVEVAGVRARLDSATNAITVQMAELRSADSNRIATTYAKLSDIPAQPDLSPYALRSELPQDYLTENDITNFATRTWIAAQGYASGADMTARLDVQDLAIAAASNALWAAQLAESVRLDRRIDAIAVTGGDRLTRLYTEDATMWQDATGVVWRVEDALGPWTATTNSVVFGSWDQAQPDMDPDLYAIYFAVNGTNAYAYTDAPGNKTNEYIGTSWYWSDWYDPEAEAAKFPITFIRNPIPGGTTNAVRQVAYTNDIPSTNGLASAAALDDLEGRLSIDIQANAGNIENLQLAIPAIGPAATNHTDAAANAATNYANDVSNNLAVVIADMASHIGSSDRISDGTNVITSAGDVLRVLSADEIKSSPEGVEYQGWTFYMEDLGAIQISYGGTNYWYYWPDPGNWSYMSIDTRIETPDTHGDEDYSLLPPLIEFWRTPAGSTHFVGKLALTNDIPQGGGAPAWEVVSQGYLSYTNGMMDVHVNFGNLSCVTNGWPDGAAMFFRLHPAPGESYAVLDPLRLVGYGMWPTNDAQAVAWRSGTNVYVNVILEERQ